MLEAITISYLVMTLTGLPQGHYECSIYMKHNGCFALITNEINCDIHCIWMELGHYHITNCILSTFVFYTHHAHEMNSSVASRGGDLHLILEKGSKCSLKIYIFVSNGIPYKLPLSLTKLFPWHWSRRRLAPFISKSLMQHYYRACSPGGHSLNY